MTHWKHPTILSAIPFQGNTKKRSLRSDFGRLSPNEEEIFTHRSKRVRFETDVKNCAEVKTSEAFVRFLRKDLDKPSMWWSKQERQGITDQCHDDVYDFRLSNKSQVEHFNNVFDQCTQAPSQSSSDYLEKATISLPTEVRGLEWGWAHAAKAHRRAHVQEVLDVQDQIQGLNAEMRERVLSSRSLRSSRPGRILARLLGEGDARHQETETHVGGKKHELSHHRPVSLVSAERAPQRLLSVHS